MRGHALLTECPGCQALPSNLHQCAFLNGRFDAANWNCQVFVTLELTAIRSTGQELEILTNESPNGSLLVWFRRVGVPQRVRRAFFFRPNLQQEIVTIDHLWSFCVLDA